MTNKLVLENIFKVFGERPDEALELAKQGEDKEEILRRTGSIVAVNDVSLAVPEGEIFVVMGLSGSGKSTLIRCINRLFEPTSGRVRLDDTEVTAAGKEELRQIRLRRIAMVFQHFALLPHKSVSENVAYGLKARGMAPAERREKALEALATVGLDAWAESFPGELSGGMQQRVGLARALAVDPEVLLMDEPFSALDPLIRRDMQDELLRLHDTIKTTIVFITHDLQEALKLGDTVAIMKDGRFIQTGRPEQIVLDPADDYVLQFTRDVDRSRVLTFRTIMEEAEACAPDTPASQVAKRLNGGESGNSLFVADDKGAPIGVIGGDSLDSRNGKTTARDLMDTDFIKVRTDEHIYDCFDQMSTVSPLAVVNRAGVLRGTVNPVDVFSHLESPVDEGELIAGGDAPEPAGKQQRAARREA